MKIHRIRSSTTAIFLMLTFTIGAGCAHNKPKSETDSGSPAVDSTDLGSSDLGNAMGLKTIGFEYDSSILSSGAKSTLKSDAEILKANSSIMIQIEGHCDARGGIQYNLALGQKRADSVQHYLGDLGVSKSRLTTISYGKERPLVSGDTDEAYAKNRRANLVITRK